MTHSSSPNQSCDKEERYTLVSLSLLSGFWSISLHSFHVLKSSRITTKIRNIFSKMRGQIAQKPISFSIWKKKSHQILQDLVTLPTEHQWVLFQQSAWFERLVPKNSSASGITRQSRRANLPPGLSAASTQNPEEQKHLFKTDSSLTAIRKYFKYHM